MSEISTSRTGQPSRWSTLHVFLHWAVVAFIIVQWWTGHDVGRLLHAEERGRTVDTSEAVLAYTHVAFGVLVLLSMLTRLYDRYSHGRPPHPQDVPNWAHWLAKATHLLLYAVLIVMPLTGLAAFFGGIEPAEEVHETLWTVLLVLIVLHIVGAFVNHFHYKNDVLLRMMPWHQRRAET
ncbi:cytochrome b [Notoacmeibacter sp. MSK16QG-6]|uniref:cytochrome b n=1 Tax=Notoacmeibacter sp. MSK16QG-6 TaxID=2957982 RepID=UPI00209D5267|nr:cytochrome b/b6 domain-containing protein [Notoacmeibacter sp. MSK16QG-6]MCP1200432.1 cytochrome b/b6 domain-containing protein [Notoacmeibacter sp. MSK16QG-6]